MQTPAATPHRHGPAEGLGMAIVVVGAVAVAEVVTGLTSGSLALISDAGHLAGDTLALGLAWWANVRALRPPTTRHTYGFGRTGAGVALINGGALVAVAGLIVTGAIGRLRHPVDVHPLPVVVVAAVALLANLALARRLGGHDHGRGLATRSAVLHLMADAGAALGVLIAGVIIWAADVRAADPVVSILIAILIGGGAVRLIREALAVLGDTVPRDVDTDVVREAMCAMPGVLGVHDLHIWSLDGRRHALSAHVEVANRPLEDVTALLRDVERRLCSDFAIEHSTLQPECPACADPTTPGCDLDDRHLAHAPATTARAHAGRGG